MPYKGLQDCYWSQETTWKSLNLFIHLPFMSKGYVKLKSQLSKTKPDSKGASCMWWHLWQPDDWFGYVSPSEARSLLHCGTLGKTHLQFFSKRKAGTSSSFPPYLELSDLLLANIWRMLQREGASPEQGCLMRDFKRETPIFLKEPQLSDKCPCSWELNYLNYFGRIILKASVQCLCLGLSIDQFMFLQWR